MFEAWGAAPNLLYPRWKHSLSPQISIFFPLPCLLGASTLPLNTGTLQPFSQGTYESNFWSSWSQGKKDFMFLLPAKLQPYWLIGVCLRPTIVFRLILEECRAQSQWEWCINRSVPVKAVCCSWSQTPLCRDLSSRLPKRGDWIHLLTNEGGLWIVHFPSYTSTC